MRRGWAGEAGGRRGAAADENSRGVSMARGRRAGWVVAGEDPEMDRVPLEQRGPFVDQVTWPWPGVLAQTQL